MSIVSSNYACVSWIRISSNLQVLCLHSNACWFILLIWFRGLYTTYSRYALKQYIYLSRHGIFLYVIYCVSDSIPHNKHVVEFTYVPFLLFAVIFIINNFCLLCCDLIRVKIHSGANFGNNHWIFQLSNFKTAHYDQGISCV